MKNITLVIFILGFSLVNIHAQSTTKKPQTTNSSYQKKYNDIDAAIENGEHKKAIELLNNILSKPIKKNKVYNESDLLKLLIAEYIVLGENKDALNALERGFKKFPKDAFFFQNLINEYIKDGDYDIAISYVDRAVKKNLSQECDLLSVKGAIYADQQKYVEATETYEQLLKRKPSCERALEGLALVYILQAQDIKEQSYSASSRQESVELNVNANDLYGKSLPLLLKLKDIYYKKKVHSSEIRSVLIKLQNVYYNLNMGAEYEQVEKERADLKY